MNIKALNQNYLYEPENIHWLLWRFLKTIVIKIKSLTILLANVKNWHYASHSLYLDLPMYTWKNIMNQYNNILILQLLWNSCEYHTNSGSCPKPWSRTQRHQKENTQLFVQSGQLGTLNKTPSVSPQHFHTLNPPCTPRLAATQPTNLHGIQTQSPFVLRTQSKNGVCHKSGHSFGSRSSSVKSQIPSERGTRVSFLFLNLYIAKFTPLAFTDVCNHHHDQDTEQFQHPPTFLPEFGIVGFLFICF